ncbi:MAG: lipopolysaccharide heptosyltransferase II [Candidatus Gastranaerophilaceae bacterium]|jgi:heptosyltransferase-2
MTKILVVRYRFIGDTILTIPFLRNLRKAYPDAQIDLMVGPVSGELLENCPYIDNLIYFDTTKKHRYENTGEKKKSFWDYVFMLKNQNYDKAYVLKRSFSSALLVFLAGIKHRIGFNTENRGFLLTKTIPYDKNKHEIECFLDVLKADNVPVVDDYLENWIDAKDTVKINDIFNTNHIDNRPKVLIHATSGNINKQWPVKYFAKIIEYLANQKNAQIFYTGTKADKAVYEEIHGHIKEPFSVKPLNLCGELNLKESAALTKRMDLMIGCDSGNLHIAASLNIPVIGIYGPMNYKKWYAWGKDHSILVDNIPCIPCELKKKCKNDRACLLNITPAQVIAEIDKKFEKRHCE